MPHYDKLNETNNALWKAGVLRMYHIYPSKFMGETIIAWSGSTFQLSINIVQHLDLTLMMKFLMLVSTHKARHAIGNFEIAENW